MSKQLYSFAIDGTVCENCGVDLHDPETIVVEINDTRIVTCIGEDDSMFSEIILDPQPSDSSCLILDNAHPTIHCNRCNEPIPFEALEE